MLNGSPAGIIVKLLMLLPLWGRPAPGWSQSYHQLTNIKATNGSTQMSTAFSGGFNTPQFSTVTDLNGDGLDDLFVFDRSGDKAQTFINVSVAGRDSFIHAPQYEAALPPLTHWALLRDLDCDGLTDIITASDTRIAWYRATSPSTFVKVTDTLHYTQGSFVKDFYVNFIDIPGVADMNGDGDLDILTFAPSGGFIEYYENQSVEQFGDCSHPSFEFTDKCWGDVYESGFNKRVDFDTCAPPFIGQLPESEARHTGSTVCVFDANGDMLMEALLGDLSFGNVNMLYNDGTPSDAHITAQDTAFPSYDVEVIIPQFPAAFFLDVNADTIRDLVVAPNARNVSADVQNTWFYRNVGSDDSTVFSFISDDFLAQHTIDVGSYSAPVFFDHNADGLLDLVMGSYRKTTPSATATGALTLYENTGTPELPQFSFITGNYANVMTPGLYGLAPTFGDLDADGDVDMIVGNETGELHRFTNTAGAGNTAQFILTHPAMNAIDVGAFSTPQLVDVDRDGDLDLIVGERNGNLNYVWNFGTPPAPLFHKDSVNANFGDINVTTLGSLVGYSYPYLFDDSLTDGYELLVGSDIGAIHRFTDIDGNLDGTFTEADTLFAGIDPGERATIHGGLLNGDGALELLVGNFRGGAEIFTTSFTTGVQPAPARQSLRLVPNPTGGLVSAVDGQGLVMGYTRIEITDPAGRLLLTATDNPFTVSQLPAGVYCVTVHTRHEPPASRLLMVSNP